MEVTRDGLLLEKATLRSEVVLLRLKSLPVFEEPTTFSWRPEHMEEECDFWLTLDYDKARESLADENAAHLNKVFLLLDRSDSLLGKDHSASFHGACLLETGRTEAGYVSVAFVCPVRWGTLPDIEAREETFVIAGPSDEILPHAEDSRPMGKTVARTITPKHPRLLISSGIHPSSTANETATNGIPDIASWPTLPNRRRRPGFRIYTNLGPPLFIIIPIFIILVFVAILPFSIKHPRHSISIFTYVLLAVAFCLRLLEPALRYPLMYSTQSEVDIQQSWWRQLDTIFGMMRWRDLRLVDWVFVPVLWILVRGITVVVDRRMS